MMNDFLEQLVAELKPLPVLKNRQLWMRVLAALLCAVIGIKLTLDFRADTSTAFWWKPALFIFAGLASLIWLTDIARPGQQLRYWHLAPLIVSDAILLWQLMSQLRHKSFAQFAALQDSGAYYCVSVITGGGAVILWYFWYGWLRKTASDDPALLGALGGFSAGCIAAAAYALHCDRDAMLYIGVYYFMPIVLLSLLGAWLGKKYLDW
jgi:hypothetical protein